MSEYKFANIQSDWVQICKETFNLIGSVSRSLPLHTCLILGLVPGYTYCTNKWSHFWEYETNATDMKWSFNNEIRMIASQVVTHNRRQNVYRDNFVCWIHLQCPNIKLNHKRILHVNLLRSTLTDNWVDLVQSRSSTCLKEIHTNYSIWMCVHYSVNLCWGIWLAFRAESMSAKFLFDENSCEGSQNWANRIEGFFAN